MKVIGITGGIGSGKSMVLHLLKEQFHAITLEADKIAHMLMEPNGSTYNPIVTQFGKEILLENGAIDREKLGKVVFGNKEALEALNQIVHPRVKAYIIQEINAHKEEAGLLVIEAALLLEDGYQTICDELWYVFARQEVRIQRLMSGRGYTKEKCISVMKNQAPDTFYMEHCDYTIDNSGDIEETGKQVKDLLKS